MGDIKTLVHTISKVCLQVLKPETPYVLETVSKDINATTQQDWELDKSHWITVIAQLQLSNLQVRWWWLWLWRRRWRKL